MRVLLFQEYLLSPACRRPTLFKAACAAALGRRGARSGELNVIFVSGRQIRRVNKRFLGHDYVTDVIAFPYERDESAGDAPFGDVYVCVDQARRQAKTLKHSHLRELLILAVHGVLHLIGHDDHAPAKRKRMFELQERIVRRLVRDRAGRRGRAAARARGDSAWRPLPDGSPRRS